MSIKVLNLINYLDAGGAESRLKNLVLEEKKDNEFQVEVSTLYSPGIFKEEIRGAGIPLRDLKLDLSLKYDLRGIVRIVNLIKKRKYNIVHVRLFPAILFAAIASLFLSKDVKFICDEVGVYNRRRRFKIFKPFDVFIYSRYSKIVCVSKQVQNSLVQWLPQIRTKTIVIPSGIPLPESIDPRSVKIYDVLFVGRLEKVKGVDILLKSINILKTKFQKKIKIAIVGKGSLRKDLENLAKKLAVDKEVEFLGIRKDIDKLMVSSKILVLPSRWEGLPMIILEAMSRGLPVIASSVGGIPEVIENKKEGMLVPSQNPGILAQVVKKLLEDESLREELTINAYKKVKENYSIETYAKNILNLYKALV